MGVWALIVAQISDRDTACCNCNLNVASLSPTIMGTLEVRWKSCIHSTYAFNNFVRHVPNTIRPAAALEL